MKNRSFKVLIVAILFSTILLANNIFASPITFDAMYTVNSEGSTILKDTFNLTETPWVYLELPQTGQNITFAWWTGPDTECINNPLCFVTTGSNNDADGKIWLSLPNWDSVKKTGTWTIEANSSLPPCCLVEGTTSFTVVQAVPEPSSFLLLLTGITGFLGLLRFRNKRN
ncbi:MAG: PEP-CTERM sorting domain-containing protein [Nitrospirae bacterium]|nr:PEP-CTERM sorting domain-containing protein [Nitrospirota bacterium]